MSERGILFSAPMVQALLAGTKTQTRRVFRPPAPFVETDEGIFIQVALGNMKMPYSVGDQLWVREAWRSDISWDADKPSNLPQGASVRYEADGMWRWTGCPGKMRPSLFMPRWASRITLEVTDVRLQRLQDICEADCIAEGIESVADSFGNGPAYCDYGLGDINDMAEWYARPIDSYRSLWVKLHGAPSWISNPWVVALTFTVERHP